MFNSMHGWSYLQCANRNEHGKHHPNVCSFFMDGSNGCNKLQCSIPQNRNYDMEHRYDCNNKFFSNRINGGIKL